MNSFAGCRFSSGIPCFLQKSEGRNLIFPAVLLYLDLGTKQTIQKQKNTLKM
jgi:hypothetical protein